MGRSLTTRACGRVVEIKSVTMPCYRKCMGKDILYDEPWRRTDADKTFLAGIQRSTTTTKMNSVRSGKGARGSWNRISGYEGETRGFPVAQLYCAFGLWSHSILVVPLNYP